MSTSALVFAIAPAIIAIVLQYLTPFSRSVFEGYVQSIFTKTGAPLNKPEPFNTLVKIVGATLDGAGAVAGLIPTFFTVVIAIASIFYELGSSYWPLFSLIVVAILATIPVLKILLGLSLYEISTLHVRRRKAKRSRAHYAFTYAELLAYWVYAMNSAVIITAAIVYCVTHGHAVGPVNQLHP